MSFLDNLPLGTIITIAGVIGSIIALINGSIDYLQFMASIGLSGVGGGAIGKARADSGKGMHRNRR